MSAFTRNILACLIALVIAACHSHGTKDSSINSQKQNYEITNIIYKDLDNIMNNIFIDKAAFNQVLSTLSKKYSVDFTAAKTLKELDKQMQNTLIRSRSTERSDLDKTKDTYDFNMGEIFNNSHNNISHDIKDKIPVVLGATYNTMNTIMTESLPYLKGKRFIILTGDRPFWPEDFQDQNINQIIYILENKNPLYKKFHSNIKATVESYLADKSHPAIKKIKFYIHLVAMINPKDAIIGKQALRNLHVSMEKYGLASKESVTAMIAARKFVYEKAINYVPTETDLAHAIAKQNNLKDYVILEAKANYQKQDRATTIDTYYKLLDYAQKNNQPLAQFALIGTKPFIYRQWLQLVMLAKKNQYPNYHNIDYIAIDNNKVSDAVFADEFARFIHVINDNDLPV